jgi:hypothetical protein
MVNRERREEKKEEKKKAMQDVRVCLSVMNIHLSRYTPKKMIPISVLSIHEDYSIGISEWPLSVHQHPRLETTESGWVAGTEHL